MANILDASENRTSIIVLVLHDLSKAFDLVPQDLLLCKLERYGVRCNTLEIFRAYLKDRKKKVS